MQVVSTCKISIIQLLPCNRSCRLQLLKLLGATDDDDDELMTPADTDAEALRGGSADEGLTADPLLDLASTHAPPVFTPVIRRTINTHHGPAFAIRTSPRDVVLRRRR